MSATFRPSGVMEDEQRRGEAAAAAATVRSFVLSFVAVFFVIVLFFVIRPSVGRSPELHEYVEAPTQPVELLM